MNDASESAAAFRRRNRTLQLATTIVIAVIAIMMALTIFILAMKGADMRSETIARMVLGWLPAIFYLLALLSLRGLFHAFSRGEFGFTPLVQVLSHIGWNLLFGATTALLITPLVLLSSDGRLRGTFAFFNVPALTLALVGVALVALSRMMQRAVALEAETARLKATLEEFF